MPPIIWTHINRRLFREPVSHMNSWQTPWKQQDVNEQCGITACAAGDCQQLDNS